MSDLTARGRVAALALPALGPAVALLVALAVASALILAYGEAPLHVYRLFLAGTWGNAYGIGQVLFKATPLVFTGLSVSIAFRAGLFNVGAEGQLTLGAFATALTGAALPSGTPGLVAVPLCLLAGALAGATAGALAGVLKATRGAHEVIVTIMLNFVILAELSDLGQRYFLRESVHTAEIVAGARLARASELSSRFAGSALSGAALLALAAAVLTWLFLERSAAGFRLRAAGAGPAAAATAGIPVGRQLVIAMALGGAVAGLGSANAVLGYKHYYEEGFSGGAGFVGIAVALLGQNRPVGIVAAALLFGTLSQGGLAVNAVVPKEIIEILQAVIILAVAVSSAELRRLAAAGLAQLAGRAPAAEPS